MLLSTKGNCPRPNLSFALNDASETLEPRDFGANENPQWDMNWKTQVDKLTVRDLALCDSGYHQLHW